MVNKLNVIICVESGLLEQQALLFIKSFKRFNKGIDYRIHVYSPRINHHPSLATLDFFQHNDVSWCSEPINVKFQNYPIANKILACNHFAKNNPRESHVVFFDTDTLFLNGIDEKLLLNDNLINLRPVDNKGPGSESSDDPNDAFWQSIYQHLSVPIPNPMVPTTVKGTLIRNYFNAGLVWSTGVKGFFQQWYDDFMKIIDLGLRPFGYLSREGDDFRCLDQVALAVTATRFQHQINILPRTYNYPIPFRPVLEDPIKFDQLVHIHYHKWLQHPGFLTHVCNEYDQSTSAYKWLIEQIPLNPIIDDTFKC